jgi:hypothetical protein
MDEQLLFMMRAVLPLLSLAVQMTVVAPRGKGCRCGTGGAGAARIGV